MTFWKNENGEIHDDMDGAALSLPSWPQGLVQITDEEADALRNPPLTLSQVQEQQISDIEVAYQTAIQQPIVYMGSTFEADESAQTVLTKSLVAGSVPEGFFWLSMDNTSVSMTFTQLQGLAIAMLAQGQAAFAKKTALKQQIRAATSVEEVQAITWN